MFLGHQEVLRAELEATRPVGHGTTKGDIGEGRWRNMLIQHLPRRFEVSKGIVVDSRGGQSHALDIIIHDRFHSPAFMDSEDHVYVPAEAVYAVIEVKPEIDKRWLEYAGGKAKSVRALHRTSSAFVMAGGMSTVVAPKPILAGIVSLCGWSARTFEAQLRKNLPSNLEERVDFGCALEVAAFNVRNGVVDVSATDIALVTFFVNLVARLRELGTVPAADYEEYARPLFRENM